MATTVAVLSAIGTAAKAVSDHKKAKADRKLIQQERALNMVKEAKQEENYEKEKTNLLKTKLAQKKALLASRGLDYTSGSVAAMLGNMEREVDEDIANSRSLNAINSQMNDVKYNYRKNKDLLDRVNSGLELTKSLL